MKFAIGLKKKYALYSTILPVNIDTIQFQYHRDIKRSEGKKTVTFDSLLRKGYYYELAQGRALQEYIRRIVKRQIDWNLEETFGYQSNPRNDTGRFCPDELQ